MMRGWENGEHDVKDPYLTLLCALYRRNADELGLSDAPTQARSDVGLVYAASLSEALSILRNLAVFDSQKHPGVISGPFSEQAANAACLDWLFGYPKWDVTGNKTKVIQADVDEIVATTTMFDNMDRQFGGDHSRGLAVKYLNDNVLPRLHGTYTDAVRIELFHAAAVLCELIGYMGYDGEKHSLAQRYFIQSLRLAKSAGDNGYGAYVLNTMSHQAMYLNRPQEALRLAQAARQTYTNGSVPIVSTEAAMMEAKAFAVLGDKTGCSNAISLAEKAFTRQSDQGAPSWASHWDETLFSAFAGDSWLALGESREAREYLDVAWRGSQGQSRRKVFAAGQLAKVALIDNNIDEAAQYALMATESVDRSRSKRSLQVVSDLRTKLAKHSSSTAVRTFADRANHLLAG